jgi:hypothetical protein
MDSRPSLQTMLEELIESRNVYNNPPASVKMKYPAIVYCRNGIENLHADDSVYKQNNSYTLTVIDEDPDSEIVKKISKLPLCKWIRHFKSDNLNHDVFTLYY